MKQIAFNFTTTLATILFTSLQIFAQQNPSLDWSQFNQITLCADSYLGPVSARTEEFKVKKILEKKEVSFDVGKITDLKIDGTALQVANCAPLPISQVSMGTTTRCFARNQDQRIFIYIQRIVNQVTGAQQQAVSVMADEGDPVALIAGGCF
jgi:hypothetical protein